MLSRLHKTFTALRWKKTAAPTIGAWNVAQRMSLEEITYTLKNKLDIYEGIWKLFTDLIEKLLKDEKSGEDP